MTKGLFIWKPGWPAKRDSPVSEISLCSYFYSKNYRAFIWTSRLARLPRSCLKEARSRLPGWKFLHINTHKRASPVAGMKVQRYRRKLFLTTVKSMSKQENCPGKRDEIFSYKHKKNSSRLPGCLAKRPARLPYKQAQRQANNRLALVFCSQLLQQKLRDKSPSFFRFLLDAER